MDVFVFVILPHMKYLTLYTFARAHNFLIINWNGYISRWLGGWVRVGGAEKGRQEQNLSKTVFFRFASV